MKKIIGQSALSAFQEVVPFLKMLYPQDAAVFACDRQKYLAFEEAESFKLGIKVGTSLKENSAEEQAMKKKEKVSSNVSRDKAEIPYHAMALPVWDDGNTVIGAVGVCLSLEHYDSYQEISGRFEKAFHEVGKGVKEISASAEHLAEIGEKLSWLSKNAAEAVQKTDEIMKIIGGISNKTKMLGMNASIEAARAGQEGKGFAVVAQEIQKLSNSTQQAASDVASIIKDMADTIESVSRETQETSAISEEQSAFAEEVSSTMDELKDQLESLGELFEILIEGTS
ncbi:methyl-accepting chemotaxis protein [Tindallia californiensis]|nr:methyl-accepting chemotaxis protein [Tindallia californiensis]